MPKYTALLVAITAPSEDAAADVLARFSDVGSYALPWKGSDDPRWAAMGVTWGERDGWLRRVTLPAGWRVVRDRDDARWSYVVDDCGARRGDAFCDGYSAADCHPYNEPREEKQ